MKMRMTKAVAATALTVAALVVTSGAEAALVTRLGGKAIYDSVANLTWLQDANYARTSGYDADGAMSWVQANVWAGSLNIDGVTGWRLSGGPMLGSGYNQTASEIGNLFYNVLGGTAFSSITTTHNANYNLFKNVQSNFYWSGVEWSPINAWLFDFGHGTVGYYNREYYNVSVALVVIWCAVVCLCEVHRFCHWYSAPSPSGGQQEMVTYGQHNKA